MSILKLLPLLLLPALPLLGADAIEVTGVISGGAGITYVHLINPRTKASAWIRVGDTFSEYRVASYNPSSDGKSDYVVLTANGSSMRVLLTVPKISSSVTARGGPNPAGDTNGANPNNGPGGGPPPNGGPPAAAPADAPPAAPQDQPAANAGN